jgi:hypothetical protein
MNLRLMPLIAFLLLSCNLNRTAEEDFTEVDRNGHPDNGSGSGLPKYEKDRVACIERINTFRATEGLGPLLRWVDAESCSDQEAKTDSETGKAHSAFGTCKEWAQNECPGWGSIASTVDGCLQSMWDERLHPNAEQGHYKNMSNKNYTMVACGFYEMPTGKVWALQNFK